MNRDHRRIIHDLAQVYGLESVSYDSEPKRNVVVTAVRWVALVITGGTAHWGRLNLRKQGLSIFAFLASSLRRINRKLASGIAVLAQSKSSIQRSEPGSKAHASVHRTDTPKDMQGCLICPDLWVTLETSFPQTESRPWGPGLGACPSHLSLFPLSSWRDENKMIDSDSRHPP